MRPLPAQPSADAAITHRWRASGDAIDHRIQFADNIDGCRASIDHPRPARVAIGHSSDHHHLLDRFAARRDATPTALAAAITAHPTRTLAPPVPAATAVNIPRRQPTAAVPAVILAIVVYMVAGA